MTAIHLTTGRQAASGHEDSSRSRRSPVIDDAEWLEPRFTVARRLSSSVPPSITVVQLSPDCMISDPWQQTLPVPPLLAHMGTKFQFDWAQIHSRTSDNRYHPARHTLRRSSRSSLRQPISHGISLRHKKGISRGKLLRTFSSKCRELEADQASSK
ncbi:hypothetical protein BJX65DRAFT_285909 [Aspergillus insuetus]